MHPSISPLEPAGHGGHGFNPRYQSTRMHHLVAFSPSSTVSAAQSLISAIFGCVTLTVPPCPGRDSMMAVTIRVKTRIGVAREAYCVHAAVTTMPAGHAKLRVSRVRRSAAAAPEVLVNELAGPTMRSADFRSFWLRQIANRLSPGSRRR